MRMEFMVWVWKLSITVKMRTINIDKWLRDELILELGLKQTLDANSLVLNIECGTSIDFKEFYR